MPSWRAAATCSEILVFFILHRKMFQTLRLWIWKAVRSGKKGARSRDQVRVIRGTHFGEVRKLPLRGLRSNDLAMVKEHLLRFCFIAVGMPGPEYQYMGSSTCSKHSPQCARRKKRHWTFP